MATLSLNPFYIKQGFFEYRIVLQYIFFIVFSFHSVGDEEGAKSGAHAAEDEEEDDDDEDPENRYDSSHTDYKKLITHPKRGSKAKHRKSKQVVQTRTSCLVKTRSQATRKLERVVGKPRPKSRKPMNR